MDGHETLLRPYGLIIEGRLELGLEVVVADRTIQEIRPHTGIPDGYVLSPAFVNAHSHLEYRGMIGRIVADDFPSWLKEITRLKQLETPDEVAEACETAAKENRFGGIAVVGEHNDRPGSAQALNRWSIAGWIYQEVITIGNQADREAKLATIDERACAARAIFGEAVSLSPHAPYTVDSLTHAFLGSQSLPVSIHVAETSSEKALFERNQGPLVDVFKRFELPLPEAGQRLLDHLEDWGYVGANRQFVHACDLDDRDIADMANARVNVAHCPRSNKALGCPTARIRRMLEAGIDVGLGLDSVASSGEIDMFAEMRAALAASDLIDEPLTPEEVWRMATSMGYRTVGIHPSAERQCWEIEVGATVPLVALKIDGAYSVRELIERSTPQNVEWVS